MKITSKSLLNMTLIFALVLTGISMSLGDILCVREDGHARIESSGIPCCSEEHDHFPPEGEGDLSQVLEADYCTNCLDIPINIVSLTKRSSINRIFVYKYYNSFTSALAVIAASDNSAYYPADRGKIEGPPYISASPLNLSTVLLC